MFSVQNPFHILRFKLRKKKVDENTDYAVRGRDGILSLLDEAEFNEPIED